MHGSWCSLQQCGALAWIVNLFIPSVVFMLARMQAGLGMGFSAGIAGVLTVIRVWFLWVRGKFGHAERLVVCV